MSRTSIFHANVYHKTKGKGKLKVKNRIIQFENDLDHDTKVEMLKVILDQGSLSSVSKPVGVALYCLRNTSTDSQNIYRMSPFLGSAVSGNTTGTQANINAEDYTYGSTVNVATGYLRKFGRILLSWNVSSDVNRYTSGGDEVVPLGHMLCSRGGTNGDSASNWLKSTKFDICFSNVRHGLVNQTTLTDHYAGWTNGYVDTASSGAGSLGAKNKEDIMFVSGEGGSASSTLVMEDTEISSNQNDHYLLKAGQKGLLLGAYLVKGDLDNKTSRFY